MFAYGEVALSSRPPPPPPASRHALSAPRAPPPHPPPRCHTDITCFEPEAKGHLVVGMPFHETYFKHKAAGGATTLRNTISSPKARPARGARAALLAGGARSGGAGAARLRAPGAPSYSTQQTNPLPSPAPTRNRPLRPP